jgi:hypothetical protein
MRCWPFLLVSSLALADSTVPSQGGAFPRCVKRLERARAEFERLGYTNLADSTIESDARGVTLSFATGHCMHHTSGHAKLVLRRRRFTTDVAYVDDNQSESATPAGEQDTFERITRRALADCISLEQGRWRRSSDE